LDIEFNTETALAASEALSQVLAARTHRRKVLGQEVLVPGQLGDALNLPRIRRRLVSRQARLREQGVNDFEELWQTLSEPTRRRVIDAMGWYDPRELDWEDPRSNRRPAADDGPEEP